MKLRGGEIYLGDCLDVLPQMPSASIDMLLVDLPYGTTDCAWDSVIPLKLLWGQYRRILKPNAAMVFTATQPFTTALMNIALERGQYKTFWVWNKKMSGSFALAKHHPLRVTEDILVCCNGNGKLKTYNPQMRTGKMRIKGGGPGKPHSIQSGLKAPSIPNYNDQYYPTNIIEVPCGRNNKVHPTQKPVELFEYLIRTYTNENDVVLDNTAGAGTSAIAAMVSNRRYVCIEKHPLYFAHMLQRIVEYD